MKLAVIGAGNMGMSYAEGISKKNTAISKPIFVLDNDSDKIEALQANTSFEASTNPAEILPKADYILLAVKPQIFSKIASNLAPFINKNATAISIMAGVKIESIKNSLQLSKIARAMPNLPSQIGLGMTGVVYNENVTQAEQEIVGSILESTGKVLAVKSEDFIDKITGIAGSGPAYIFYFIEALEKAAVDMGFEATDAKELAVSTFEGAVQLYKQNNISPSEWMNRVASKGGTTRAALDQLDSDQVSKLIQKAAFAAYHRAIELGNEN